MNKGVPNGTFRFEIENTPTSRQDVEVLTWALKNALEITSGPKFEDPGSIYFEQPYEQGGGLMTLRKVPYDSKEFFESFGPAHDDPGGADEDLAWRFAHEQWDPQRYTGWVLTDWYTDSMTGIFEAPIQSTDDPTYPFEVWEM